MTDIAKDGVEEDRAQKVFDELFAGGKKKEVCKVEGIPVFKDEKGKLTAGKTLRINVHEDVHVEEKVG